MSIIAILLAFISANAGALGLGDISLKSNLNQPLRAEIALLEVRDLTEAEILVSLATQVDFDRIGVDRVYFLTDLRFTVDLNGRNGPVIRIESKKLVREPYLNFVVLAQWPTGKLLREYTVLMDLPVFAEQAPAPVSRPSAQSTPRTAAPAQRSTSSQANPRSSFNEGRQAASTNNSSSSSSNAAVRGQSSYSSGDEYEIRANDTLWEIALAVRPDSGVSVHQTMVALKQNNPNAFIKNNINLLKRGEILRVPNRDQMTSLSRGQAINEFAQLANVSTKTDDVSAAPLEGRRSYSNTEESSAAAEGRVKLSSPDNAESSASGSSSGSDNQTSVKALEGQLSATMEELDKSSRENSELKSKISSLEEQMETMEKMIEVSNENMRALELSAQKAKEDAAEAALAAQNELESSIIESTEDAGEEVQATIDELAEAGESVGESVDDGNIIDSESIVPSAVDSELEKLESGNIDPNEVAEGPELETTPEVAVESTPVAAAVPPVAASKPPVKSDGKNGINNKAQGNKAKKGIVDIIMDNIIYVGLGLLALVGIVVVLFKKLFSKDEIGDDELLAQTYFDENEDDPLVGLDSDNDAIDEDLGLTDADSLVESDLVDDVAEYEEEQELDAEPQTEDVVAEADIYIAYGKYDQAEDMLIRALDAEPGFHDARIKLLETYAAQQDVDNFDPHFANIVATGSDTLISRGEELRSTIADAPEFSSSDYDTSDFESLLGIGGLAAGAAGLLAASDASEADLADDSTVVNFRGNVAAQDEPEESLLEEPLELDSSLDVNSDLSLDTDLDFENSLDLDDSLDADTGSDDELELGDSDLEDVLDFDESDTNEADEIEGLNLDLGDDEFDLGELHLTDELDDTVEVSLDSSIEQLAEAEAEQDESVNEDITLDTESSGLDLDESLDIDSDLDLSLDDTAQITDLSKADTLVFPVDDAISSLKEAGDRVEGSTDELGDDLSLDDDLDLSSLDDDLKALSQDLDGELDEDSVLKELDDDLGLDGDLTSDFDLGADLDSELDKVLEDDLEDLSVDSDIEMEEPVTDFEELVETSSDELSIDLDGEDDAQIGIDTVSSPENLDSDDDFLLPDIDPDGTDDGDLDFLSDSDETATKLDLARAYIDMGDEDGAKDILGEILKEGNDQHKKEAESLMTRIEA